MKETYHNLWTQDKQGNFKKLNCSHDIKLDFETNSIRFRINVTGFLYGYIIGKFNNYKKKEDYKLVWEADRNDGSLWLTKNIFNIDNLIDGINEFTYILVDLNGNEFKISTTDNSFSPLNFYWQKNNSQIKIKSSSSYIIPGFNFDAVAITESVNGHKILIDVDWEILPKNKHIEISEDGIFINKQIDKNITNLTLKCISKDNPLLTATKNIRINHENSNRGKLVHFFKKEQDYQGNDYCWELWNFGANSSPKAVNFFAQTDFGVVGYCNSENVIARKKVWHMHWHNDWSEQTPSFHLNSDIDNHYIVHGDINIYTNLKDVIKKMNPKITYAVMDSKDKIIAYLSDTPSIGTIFELYVNSKKVENVNIIVKDIFKEVIFTNLPQNIKGCDLVEIRANNTFMPTKVTMRNYLDNFYYNGNDMGISFSDNDISLKLWAPMAKRVELLLYKDTETNDNEPNAYYVLDYDWKTGLHSIDLSRYLAENKFYLYKLYFDDINAQGKRYTKVTYAVDPYAVGLGINGDRGYILDINSKDTMPKEWLTHKQPNFTKKEDAIIYEVHLRDFTISNESNVDDSLKGKFLGACQSGTYYENSDKKTKVSTGIDSLSELGITHVHFLPFFDFSSVDESKLYDTDNRNWGYDPKNYNAPDGSYSINPEDPKKRILGLRKMVQQFHKKDMSVIMDVVYNHMTDTENFDKITPNYYFRTDKFGRFTNGSGCGNELNTERPMVSKFIQDSIIHWIENYKIDGIRFDLMELIDLSTIKSITRKIKDINPSIIVYGEPWKGGDSPLTNGTYKGTQKGQNFSIFNDFFRDALRGNNNPGNGFINGDAHNSERIGKVIEGLKGSIHELTDSPIESINYVDAHDNYTLWDHFEKSQNHSIKSGNYRNNIPKNLFECRRLRRNALALGMILTAQGIPFIHGGAEFLRTKQGDHNSYKSNDNINAFHWSDKLKFKPFFDYVKGLIELRRQHPAFRMNKREMIHNHLCINTAHNDDTSGVIISHFKNNANNDKWKDIIVIYNATAIDGYDVNDITPTPSSGIWNIIVDYKQAGIKTIETVKHKNLPLIRSHSMLVAHS